MKKSIFWKLNSQLILKNNSPILLIKFVTFSMKNHHYYQNLNDLKKFVLFGSLQEIKFYCIAPKIEQILDVLKKEYRENVMKYFTEDDKDTIEKTLEIKKDWLKLHQLQGILRNLSLDIRKLEILNSLVRLSLLVVLGLSMKLVLRMFGMVSLTVPRRFL